MAAESVKEIKKVKKAAVKTTQEKEGKSQCSYEMVLVLNPEAEEEKSNTKLENIKKLVAILGGDISEVEQWGKRKLAYPIKGLTEGDYVLTRFKMEPAKNKELEARLKISEDVIRHLLIKLSG